ASSRMEWTKRSKFKQESSLLSSSTATSYRMFGLSKSNEITLQLMSNNLLYFYFSFGGSSRPSATSEIVCCLKDLHAFLERILSAIDSLSGNSNSKSSRSGSHRYGGVSSAGSMMILRASELYPTLGPLLVRLCRNPVVLSSNPIADLVAQSVIKYSRQSQNQSQQNQDLSYCTNQKPLGSRREVEGDHVDAQGGWIHQRAKPSPQRAWCAARLRDMFEVSRHHLSDTTGQSFKQGEINTGTRNRRGFGTLFQVSDDDMRQQRAEYTIATLSRSLETLQKMIQEKSLITVDSEYWIKRNHQLSGLCGPLVSNPTAAPLIHSIIDMAFTLKSTRVRSRHKNTIPSSPLDLVFVKQVMEMLDETRQTYLLRLIDKMMTISEQPRDFIQSRDKIVREYIEQSRLFAAISTDSESGYALVQQPILEDLAELTGKVTDWRFVQTCVLLVEWIITTRIRCGQRMEIDHSEVWGRREEFPNMDEREELEAMVSSACSILQQGSPQIIDGEEKAGDGVLQILERFLSAQKAYVFYSAGPEQLGLRRSKSSSVAGTLLYATFIPGRIVNGALDRHQ
ncbi:hypothetical protein BGZ65_005686, partial [Modicella reniformis]